MNIPFLQAVIAAIVWVVANVVYLDMKRKGVRGFTRFAAFWTGNPTTWITFFAVPEVKQPAFEPEPDDDDVALLEAVRRDRALRPGSAEAATDGGDDGGDDGTADGREAAGRVE